jgi:hypothetical protein
VASGLFSFGSQPLSSKVPTLCLLVCHLLQVYSFSDPSANSYGNQNFTYMSQYMDWEAGLGKRSVAYYGETAYW